MIVRIFKSGTSNGEAPVNYLLSMKDHAGQPRDVAPEVLEGHPATTISVINAIQRKHRYVSGVLAFRDDEKPTRAQMYEVIDSFKKAVAPGLSDRQFNSLFVLHREKGNDEIHFVVPMVEFASGRGKRLNVHPPGARNLALYEAFTQVTNHELGYGQVVPDTMRAAISVTDRKLPSSKGKRRSTHLIQQEIVQAVQAGQVNNRKELVQWLDDALGVTVTRQGQDYLSVKMPGATKAMRLRGPLFEAGTDYRSLNPPKSGKPGTVMLTVPEYQKALASLDTLVSERRAFNIKAYLTPRTFPRTQGAGSASATLKPANFTRATTKEKPMPIKKTPHTERIVEDAMTTAKQADDEHVKKPVIASTEQATQRMKAMRDSGTTVSTPKPSTAMDTINSIQAAIGALQQSINAAVADMANATTPDEAKKAQQRLMALMEQMARLEQQLQDAKVRQINEAPVMKLKV
ncbi:relaxase/mobilization nuclease domain-containing protein [Variovorax sp. N23]|uniref:relaxase/mobilization nuclease domain-containing protein n=1 Tax=Variovorax sp. N23 TaxID=2980555 RepID=UPI0021CA4073|nr:relaxase/mobilization nuclease domain-containing protein [Variovorax sp. N23]MCU4118424.1 relaxase/mobilization nuclease domain-containing protein [Variovorax sp. N23]